MVEHFLGKEEVMGSNPINGSDYNTSPVAGATRPLARFSQASDAQFSITVGAESRFLRVGSDFYLKFTSPPLFYSLQWLKKISTGPSRT